MDATQYLFHYVHHKDLSVGLGNEKELKVCVIRWIQHVTEEERSGFGEVLLQKQMILQEYLDTFGKPDGIPDEIINLFPVQNIVRTNSYYHKDEVLE